jgi:hypothetical protein
MEIPVRMRQTRMHPLTWESPPGFKCQTQSTREKAATFEVLGQLSLEVVGEAPAVVGDEAPGLLLDAALMRALDGRKNAPKNAAVGARRRAPRHRPGRAAQAQVKVSV